MVMESALKVDTLISTSWPWRIYAVLLVLVGLILAGMGMQLLLLGGSPYYVVAGLPTLFAGALIWRGDHRGALLYLLMLAGTYVWAFVEVGTDAWALVARLLWSRPVGTTRNSGPFGMAAGMILPMGVPVNGGVLVTGGGLSFFAGSQDGLFRAYDTRSGAVLWRVTLPSGSEATAGGAVGALATDKDDYVVAYALPAKGG